MPFKKKLEAAKADEAHAVKTYGKMASTGGRQFGMSGMLKDIQSEEKGHHSKLSKAIEGLRKAK